MKPSTPLRAGLLVKNPIWNAWLRLNDLVLAAGSKDRRDGKRASIPVPRRLLIASNGHLGDAVLATSVFAPLRAAFGDVEIGVLSPSWTRPVFDNHPAVTRTHVADHWKLNRAVRSPWARWRQWRRTSVSAIREIRSVRYEAAIDLSAYYPNFARVLTAADIPTRVGYPTGGNSPLYSHVLPWIPGRHVADDHRALLSALFDMSACEPPRANLRAVGDSARRAVDLRLHDAGLAGTEWVVLHMGAGAPQKLWPSERWRALAGSLIATEARVVLTGAGASDARLARELAAAVPGVVNLCDKLEWDEFQEVLTRARAVISVDTVAIHVAGAVGTPCVALMTGIDAPQRWRPLGDRVVLLSEPVSCAPCFRSKGCARMSCVRDIRVEAVLSAVSALAAPKERLSESVAR
jgi:ADP-heptose:LPS heptosyltransferase